MLYSMTAARLLEDFYRRDGRTCPPSGDRAVISEATEECRE